MKYRVIKMNGLFNWKVQRKSKWKFWQRWETVDYFKRYDNAVAALRAYRILELDPAKKTR